MNEQLKHITVTVGVPAYNERTNIADLLRDILAQKLDGFSLEKIIVYSDGSTDGTNEAVLGLNNNIIELVAPKERKGVAVGQNEIISRAKSDVLVLLNADVKIPIPNFLQEFLEPFQKGTPDLVSCTLKAYANHTFFEKVLNLGMDYKNQIFENYNNGNNLYTCHGAARALSRKMYSQFRFQTSLGEDMYSYLFAKANGLRYLFNPKPTVYFKLPDNFRDHLNQSYRFFYAKSKIPKTFQLTNFEKLPLSRFFFTGIWFFLKHPLLSVVYLVVTVCVFIMTHLGFFKPNTEMWQSVGSTKQIGAQKGVQP